MIDSNTICIGFDGHRGQEAQWSHNFDMYVRSKNIFPPKIEYKRYSVDELSKNAQFHYNSGNILFPERLGKYGDEEGELFLDQFHSFCGKANTPRKMKDDAPDALICAMQLAFYRKYKFY